MGGEVACFACIVDIGLVLNIGLCRPISGILLLTGQHWLPLELEACHAGQVGWLAKGQ